MSEKEDDDEERLLALARELRKEFQGLLDVPLPAEIVKLLDDLDRLASGRSDDVSGGEDDA